MTFATGLCVTPSAKYVVAVEAFHFVFARVLDANYFGGETHAINEITQYRGSPTRHVRIRLCKEFMCFAAEQKSIRSK